MRLRLETDGKIRYWYEYLPGKFMWRYYGRVYRSGIILSMKEAPRGS